MRGAGGGGAGMASDREDYCTLRRSVLFLSSLYIYCTYIVLHAVSLTDISTLLMRGIFLKKQRGKLLKVVKGSSRDKTNK